MTGVRNLRRCAAFVIEPREDFALDLAGLFSGRDALTRRVRWLAIAPHLDAPVDIANDEIAVLSRVSDSEWTPVEQLRDDTGRVERLLALGLLVGDAPDDAMRERDERFRALHWSTLPAAVHHASRWSGVGMDGTADVSLSHSLADIVAAFGEPPPHVIEKSSAAARVPLRGTGAGALRELARRRVTCRNFAPEAALDASTFGAIVETVFGAEADVELAPGIRALKKANPSGGGLHALEAYFIVRRVEGVAAGLYHYHPTAHALEPIARRDPAALRDLALTAVAGQAYFADAPVLIAIAARFARSFWKYRRHAKAYRALVLETGHVAQNLYLAAAEAGLGAFVTAAINEADIERAFALDPLEEGVLAVVGFGPRAAERATREFDPLGTVWRAAAQD